MINWKGYARTLRAALKGARARSALWEGLAKERPNATTARELDVARMDAFTGWISARILKTALQDALACGRFSTDDRDRLTKELGKVHFEDPEQFKC